MVRLSHNSFSDIIIPFANLLGLMCKTYRVQTDGFKKKKHLVLSTAELEIKVKKNIITILAHILSLVDNFILK